MLKFESGLLPPVQMRIFIKNMVSQRCKMVVKDEMSKMGLHFVFVELGEVELMETLLTEQREQLNKELQRYGLELMNDKRAEKIGRIKDIVKEVVEMSEETIPVNFSVYLSGKMGYPYTFLAAIFSEVQGTPIEQYMIALKVERIKEMILYSNLNMTEIAWKLNYSSVAHLSGQFKKVTGLTPTHFRKLKESKQALSPLSGELITETPKEPEGVTSNTGK
jgi:YesN/AraC family two-component response regulator